MKVKLQNLFKKYYYSLSQGAQKADPLDSFHVTDTDIDPGSTLHALSIQVFVEGFGGKRKK